MKTAIILILVAVGSVLFHLLSPWWWTPIASNWRYIDDTIIITFWITGGVFCAVVFVYGLPRPALSSQAWTASSLSAGEQEARMVVERGNRRRSCGYARSGPGRVASVHYGAGGKRPRSRFWVSSGSGATVFPGRMDGWAPPTSAMSVLTTLWV